MVIVLLFSLSLLGLFWGALFGCFSVAMVGISLCVCLVVVVGIWMLVLSVYCSEGLVAVVCFFLVACLLFLLFLFCC